MSDLISRFEMAIRRVNLIYGVTIPIVLTALFSLVLNIINPSFYRQGSFSNVAYFIAVGLGFLLLITHILSHGNLSKKQLGILYLGYHVVLGLLIVFVDPFPTPFFYFPVVLLISVDLLFGFSYFCLSALYYSLIFSLSLATSNQPISSTNLMLCLIYILGGIVLALLVSKYRQISDEERKLLASTTKESSIERQRLLSLINNMGDAVLATDSQGKVVLYNGALLNLLDTNLSLEGKRFSRIINLRDKKHHRVDLFKRIQDTSTGLTTTDLIHEYANNDFINLYINVSPIRIGFKENVESGYIIILRDITKEKSLEEERDEFISVVSHELRTPVAIAEGNISNALYVSGKHHDPKMVTNSLSEAHDQVLFLASMINDLATLSRAERTDSPLEITEVQPADLLSSVSKDYVHEAATKKLKLVANAASGVKPIKTSELYLHEILQNFITNALKYTKKGSIIAHVRSDKQGNAIFSVADTGIGLSTADQKKIFDKFFRSEDYRTRESSGTGLGLYVTAKLAHRIKAVISVESTLNKGSTFTITVPSLK